MALVDGGRRPKATCDGIWMRTGANICNVTESHYGLRAMPGSFDDNDDDEEWENVEVWRGTPGEERLDKRKRGTSGSAGRRSETRSRRAAEYGD